MAEMDARGNVNVSRFGGRVIGPGGFIDITHNTPFVIFTGTFTAGGLETVCEDGRLRILREGKYPKCVAGVGQITFSGDRARREGQRVLYVTERAVFRLTADGVELVEIAPGVDPERDVLKHMALRPLVSPDLNEMDPRIFRYAPMCISL